MNHADTVKLQVAAMRFLMCHDVTWESRSELISIIQSIGREATALQAQVEDASAVGASETIKRLKYETDIAEAKLEAIKVLKDLSVLTY